jgi:hypothetical protein
MEPLPDEDPAFDEEKIRKTVEQMSHFERVNYVRFNLGMGHNSKQLFVIGKTRSR